MASSTGGDELFGVQLYRLDSDMWLDAPRDEVFAFFADAANLELLTPESLRFRMRTPAPAELGPGATLDYRLRIRGVPVLWRSEITVWDPPQRFVDEQRKGPYRRWIHEHSFAEKGGGTACRDRVTFAAPGGPLAPLVVERFVAPDLERIFRYRQDTLAERFGDARPGSIEIAAVP